MLAKWIVAEASNRAAFDEAQSRWCGLAGYEGFLVQVGGWLESSTMKAGVLVVWRDFGAYRGFIESGHDELAAGQQDTFQRIQISVASVIMRINQSDPRILAETAEVVRVSDATLEPNNSPIFVARQMEIWNPVLASADGMLGALICRVDGNRDRFLAASFWRNRGALENFEQTIFPATRKRAGMQPYIKELIVYHFDLERSWHVVKRA
jgi:heme-degrading monooxygenase HmoA